MNNLARARLLGSLELVSSPTDARASTWGVGPGERLSLEAAVPSRTLWWAHPAPDVCRGCQRGRYSGQRGSGGKGKQRAAGRRQVGWGRGQLPELRSCSLWLEQDEGQGGTPGGESGSPGPGGRGRLKPVASEPRPRGSQSAPRGLAASPQLRRAGSRTLPAVTADARRAPAYPQPRSTVAIGPPAPHGRPQPRGTGFLSLQRASSSAAAWSCPGGGLPRPRCCSEGPRGEGCAPGSGGQRGAWDSSESQWGCGALICPLCLGHLGNRPLSPVVQWKAGGGSGQSKEVPGAPSLSPQPWTSP